MTDDTITLQCGKCGNPMRVHKPLFTRQDNGLVSVVMLVPSWSPEERTCPRCKAIITPVFEAQLPIKWIAMEPKEIKEPSRIILPGPVPLDVAKRLKEGAGG
jgi:hypothetical protein